MFRFLFELIEMILAEFRRWMGANLRFEDPTAALLQDLQLMYGSGLIGVETYFQHREKLLDEKFGRGELMLLRSHAARQVREGENGPSWRPGVEAQRSIRRVWISRARLADARVEAEAAVRQLEAGLPGAAQAADQARAQAAAALPDEEAAYSHLESRQKLLERSRAMQARLQSLRAGLRRIDALNVELDTYERELRAVDAQERITSLELSIQEGLL